jgi:hypothetical protein
MAYLDDRSLDGFSIDADVSITNDCGQFSPIAALLNPVAAHGPSKKTDQFPEGILVCRQ